MRGEVVIRQVVGEEVEPVTRDEPAPDGGRVLVHRAGRTSPHRHRRAGDVGLVEVEEEEPARAVGGAGEPGQRRQVARAAAVARDVHSRRDVPRVLDRLVPATRSAANDEPYSTSRRSSRWYQTRCGIRWTSGCEPVAIDARHTGVSDGKVDVARACSSWSARKRS